MATSKGTMFDPTLVKDLITKVKGKSALAALCGQTPIPFNGLKEMIFSMDNEIDIVAENGKKTEGGIAIAPVKIVPVKFEYGARISDEFMIATEEEQLDILTAFNDGFAKKVAKGLDLAAMHGINPRTGTASSVIGDNHFDAKVTQTVDYASATPDANLEDAIAVVDGSEGDVTGRSDQRWQKSKRMESSSIRNLHLEHHLQHLTESRQASTKLYLEEQRKTTVLLETSREQLNGDIQRKFLWKLFSMVIRTTQEKT